MTTWNISSRLGMTGTVTVVPGQFLQWNIVTPTIAIPTFTYGGPTTIPLVGDWNGDGTEGIGIYDPSSGVFSLRQTPTTGIAPDITAFPFGQVGQFHGMTQAQAMTK